MGVFYCVFRTNSIAARVVVPCTHCDMRVCKLLALMHSIYLSPSLWLYLSLFIDGVAVVAGILKATDASSFSPLPPPLYRVDICAKEMSHECKKKSKHTQNAWHNKLVCSPAQGAAVGALLLAHVVVCGHEKVA